MNAVVSIARFTLLEAWRTRLPWLVLGLLACALLSAEFAASLALTASASYRSAVYASAARFALVFIGMLFVATSVARELQDRLLDLTLSRPVSRSAWFAGRLLGCAVLAAILATLATLPLFVMAPPGAVAAWGVSLAAELLIVTAASLTCIVALAQVTPAVLAVSCFYLLSRAIEAIVLMSEGPAVDPTQWSTPLIAKLVALIALGLPALDRYTQSAWLSGAPGAPSVLPALLGEAAVYVVLLAAIGLFDLHRRDE